MNFSHTNFTEIEQLSQFARAIALPIRVFIIRMIVENGNAINKQAFAGTIFNTNTIDKHIKELKALGIIKVSIVKTQVTYCIDQALLDAMSTKFNAFFGTENKAENLKGQLQAGKEKDESAVQTNHAHFGAYLKALRNELNLSQENLAKKINVDRTLLSRIECGKKDMSIDILKPLAGALYTSAAELTYNYNLYYSV